MAVIKLLRRSTGEPLAVMDGRLITEMRTAAVSAVALDALGSAQVRSLGILGSGVQARAHLQALRLVRPSLKDIRVWSRTPANAERLAAEVGGRAVTIREAAAADVVLTVTSSTALYSKAAGWRRTHWCLPSAPLARRCANWTTKPCGRASLSPSLNPVPNANREMCD